MGVMAGWLESWFEARFGGDFGGGLALGSSFFVYSVPEQPCKISRHIDDY